MSLEEAIKRILYMRESATWEQYELLWRDVERALINRTKRTLSNDEISKALMLDNEDSEFREMILQYARKAIEVYASDVR